MINKGTLCISLDFEKFWGIHDVSNLKDVEQKLNKVSVVIERLLNLFEQYEIHCTWAVVGLLNFESLNGLFDANKHIDFKYLTSELSPFPLSKQNLRNFNKDSFLAKNDIDKIKSSLNQELASHTYSHFYCLEDGVGQEDFSRDIELFNKYVSDKAKSIVFPRNQIDENCLKVCRENGILTYRGNQSNKYWKNIAYTNEKLSQKIGRTIDAYIKITPNNLIEWKALENKSEGLINIPASRFLKPAKFPGFIERLKINRVKKQMLESAQQNKIYHLWWHPHNFTSKTEQNFKQLEALLVYYTKLKKEYGYQSLTMAEIAKQIG